MVTTTADLDFSHAMPEARPLFAPQPPEDMPIMPSEAERIAPARGALIGLLAGCCFWVAVFALGFALHHR